MTDFSYQLYSSRNFPPLADTLRMLAGLGYSAVEGFGALYTDAAKVDTLKRHLGDSGLRMPTAHFGLDMLENERDHVSDTAEALGIETIYCPFIAPDQRPDTGKAYEALGARLQEAGKPFRDAGLGFGWHNHAFEFVTLADGAVPQAALFEGAPDLEWEADLAWVLKGGGDPFHWVGAYRDRITSVHIKDIAPDGENGDEDGWADVGHGVVDWAGLLPIVQATGCRHFIMEHDNPSDDARFAERSIAAARSFAGGAA